MSAINERSGPKQVNTSPRMLQRTNREIGGRVGWIGPQDAAGHFKVGIEFDTAVTDFWG
jgi:hypothetical protein